jgi:hypothetical protein
VTGIAVIIPLQTDSGFSDVINHDSICSTNPINSARHLSLSGLAWECLRSRVRPRKVEKVAQKTKTLNKQLVSISVQSCEAMKS